MRHRGSLLPGTDRSLQWPIAARVEDFVCKPEDKAAHDASNRIGLAAWSQEQVRLLRTLNDANRRQKRCSRVVPDG